MKEEQVAELLKPRVKCIGHKNEHYPGSPFEIGEVIFIDKNERYYPGEEDYIWIEPSLYPHLFRKMEWWEEREEKPEYVKIKKTGEVIKPTEWKSFRGNPHCYDGDNRDWHLSYVLPASLSDYETYLTSKPLNK